MPTSKRVFQTIKDEIEQGKYQAGQYLDIKQIAEENMVSVAPVREALLRLSERGLLEWRQNRGFAVAHLTKREIEFFYAQLRSAYLMAIDRLENDLQSVTLDGVPDHLSEPLAPQDADTYKQGLVDLDRRFFTRAEQSHVDAIWSRLWLVRSAYLTDPTTLNQLIVSQETMRTALAMHEFALARDTIALAFNEVEARVISLFAAK